MTEDIRWQQSFSNFRNALDKLVVAVEILKEDVSLDEDEDAEAQAAVDEILKDGLIHRFEYTCRLAWTVMKDYATQDENTTIEGPGDAIREAFKLRLISEVNEWMEMLESYKLSTQAYDDAAVNLLYKKISKAYCDALVEFEGTMEGLVDRGN
jgi:nucleotidyltransferase substrate binding protein (TIGR01987 family)